MRQLLRPLSDRFPIIEDCDAFESFETDTRNEEDPNSRRMSSFYGLPPKLLFVFITLARSGNVCGEKGQNRRMHGKARKMSVATGQGDPPLALFRRPRTNWADKSCITIFRVWFISSISSLNPLQAQEGEPVSLFLFSARLHSKVNDPLKERIHQWVSSPAEKTKHGQIQTKWSHIIIATLTSDIN